VTRFPWRRIRTAIGGCSDRYEEVAGDYTLCVVTHECGPSQVAGCSAGTRRTEVFCNRPRRDTNGELERELIGDSLLAPSWVLFVHLSYQLSDVFRQRRTASIARLRSPEQLECRAMPFDESLRLIYD
jgi:hypothetical protein